MYELIPSAPFEASSAGGMGSADPNAATPPLDVPTVAQGASVESEIKSQLQSTDVTCDRSRTPAHVSKIVWNSLAMPGSPRPSGSSTPARLQSPTAQEYNPGSTTPARNYERDASIALVGFRGTGVSSLAVIASTALGFRLIDSGQHFYQATGLSRSSYRSTHGVLQYRQEELRQMHLILSENDTKSVIVCGPGAVEATGQSLLSEYGKLHPVIHILRDTQGIQKHLSVWDANTTSHFVRLGSPIYRSLSSFEFYNLDEPSLVQPPGGCHGTEAKQPPQTLALKQVEEDFLQLIRNITAKCPGYERIHESRYGIGSLPPETRPYSYALSLRTPTLKKVGMAIRDIDTSADAVELILPFEQIHKTAASFDASVADEISRQYYTARRSIRLPIIIHIEPPVLCPKSSSNESAILAGFYLTALHHGLRLAPEYLSVDLSCSEQRIRQLVAAKGSTKIIGHHFSRNAGASGWSKPERNAMLTRAEELGCDMARLCQQAATMEDNFDAQTFIHKIKALGRHHIPIIAYNTGPLGRMSNFLNSILTPVTHSILRAHAPECTSSSLLTIPEAQSALYTSFVLDPLKFGIYGGNVSQSLSPAMHNAAFEQCGMPHTYQAYTYPTLRELETLARDPNFGGLSITAPFKRDVILMVDKISSEARAIGAVNTLLPLKDADANPLLDSHRKGPVVTLYGDNTDWIGIHTCIRHNLSPINAVQRQTVGLIIGAGGMARAAAYAMLRLGVRRILVYNRSVESAEELAKQFHGQSVSTPRPELSRTELSSPGETTSTETPGWPNSASTVTVIRSKDDPWPVDTPLPTIVVSSVPHSPTGKPMADNSLPRKWLANSTGGVVVEVCDRYVGDPCYVKSFAYYLFTACIHTS